MRLGQKAISKSVSQLVVDKGNRRGSFLSRSEIILAKLAESTKVDEVPVIGAPKVATKFTFQTVSATSASFREVITQFANLFCFYLVAVAGQEAESYGRHTGGLEEAEAVGEHDAGNETKD